MSRGIGGHLSRRRLFQGFSAAGLGYLSRPLSSQAQATPAAGTPTSSQFPITVTHVMGETAIPARPARIVATTDFLDLDTLLTLGIAPVTFGKVDPLADLLPWQGAAAGIPTYDAATEIDLEAIAAANPDLIVTMPRYFDGWYETLSAIAPTVVIDWEDPWRGTLRAVGLATGESVRAEAEIAHADTRIAVAKRDLAPASGMPLMVGFMFATEFWIWGEEMSAAQLFRDLGLDFRGGQDPVMTVTSLEQLSLLNPAEILLSVLNDAAAIELQEASPIFQSLPAVKRGGYGLLTVEQTSALADSISPLSLAWALPDFVALILQLAAGEGKKLA